MFNKLKQFKDMRSQAKDLQNTLADEYITEESNGVEVKLNGNLEVQSVKVNTELEKDYLERTIKDVTNKAIKKTQKIMAKKMQDMGGIPGMN
ncbi:MAG TPA: YbaB/EbfC family nucleoid-associated protein [Patescibacteria group bacterium]|nr:YbaB/EbfC family nucleoid-associated protein [Patescibacteria group bacterium]